MQLYEAIAIRASCRTFDGRSIPESVLAPLRKTMHEDLNSPFGGRVRFQIIQLDDPELQELKTLGTYGFIRGSKSFIAGIVGESPRSLEALGFCMEKVILQATSLGLGTCWIGGTFRRSRLSRYLQLKSDEDLPAITPIGYPADASSVRDKLIKWSVQARKRRPWTDLFFSMNGDPLEESKAGPYAPVLEAVRLAPSARNGQPWRIVMETGEIFHLFIEGLGSSSKNCMKQIDGGIAVSHFEIAARSLGFEGVWRRQDPRFIHPEWDYLISWVGKKKI